jgi:glycosyltransferase involved in cell wall biosynthesis
MKVMIVSLKYAPGLAQLFFSIGKELQQRNHEVLYLLSSGYDWLIAERDMGQVHFVSSSTTTKEMLLESTVGALGISRAMARITDAYAADSVLIYNPHPLNSALLRRIRSKNPNCKRAVYLHEPYSPDKSSFGIVGKAYYTLAEFFQTRSLAYLNHVIVPSPYARKLFTQRYPDYAGQVHESPIMLPDIPYHEAIEERRYFSLVGTINKHRGIDGFVELINYAVQQDAAAEFQIVTRSNIAEGLQKLSDAGKNATRIVNKPQISDEEMTQALLQSKLLFLPHKQVTQSGNVPVSFRVGTPIVARDLPGFTQHIQHKENGYIVSVDASIQEMWQAFQYVQVNLAFLSSMARESFCNCFSDQNWERHYQWML